MKLYIITCICVFYCSSKVVGHTSEVWLEAESFQNKGGWVVDQQFMDLIGSPYLMAHGMGKCVADASTKVNFPEIGSYNVYVRTYNWTSPWYEGKGPGKFEIQVDGKRIASVGDIGNQWCWQKAGSVRIKKKNVTVTLKDLTGFNGRCDAIYFTTASNEIPPSEAEKLQEFREKFRVDSLKLIRKYDLVVVGGGVAGISAAIAASRLGCKVALINDRPVLGGNNSSEIRVHLGGRIEIGPYKALGALQKEFGPSRKGNAKPADYYEDKRKEDIVIAEENIALYANMRAIGVDMDGKRIKAVRARHIETGEERVFEAPLFSDCTGDGTIGFLAGADFLMGRESKSCYGESLAPDEADEMTMGASVQWYSKKTDRKTKFPFFEYGIKFNDESCEKVTMGEWTWETGMNLDQITDFEKIRDYGLLVVYSNWSYLKNKWKKSTDYNNRELEWVAYIAGKRESRRLLGDYVLKEDDLRRYVVHEDGTACTTWTIDLHYPDPDNSVHFPGMEFKSIARHIEIHPYPVPYRCLYSRNIENLFMAGRNISVTHVALGTTRVMRTTGMLGEVVGMAASICREHKVLPREVYQHYLDELKNMMRKGVGQGDHPNNQKYNMGGSLKIKPEIGIFEK